MNNNINNIIFVYINNNKQLYIITINVDRYFQRNEHSQLKYK